MSGSQRVGVLLLVGLAFILGSAWHFAGAQGEKAKPAVQKWEYKRVVIIGKPTDDEALTILGNEGFEYAGSYSRSAGVDFIEGGLIFKRAKQ